MPKISEVTKFKKVLWKTNQEKLQVAKFYWCFMEGSNFVSLTTKMSEILWLCGAIYLPAFNMFRKYMKNFRENMELHMSILRNCMQ